MVALEEEVDGGDVRRRQVPPRRLRVERLLRGRNSVSAVPLPGGRNNQEVKLGKKKRRIRFDRDRRNGEPWR